MCAGIVLTAGHATQEGRQRIEKGDREAGCQDSV